MANFDLTVISLEGLYEFTPRVRAEVGLGLFDAVCRYADSGIPTNAYGLGKPAAPTSPLDLDFDLPVQGRCNPVNTTVATCLPTALIETG